MKINKIKINQEQRRPAGGVSLADSPTDCGLSWQFMGGIRRGVEGSRRQLDSCPVAAGQAGPKDVQCVDAISCAHHDQHHERAGQQLPGTARREWHARPAGGLVAPGEGEVGAGSCQRQGDAAAEPAGGAGTGAVFSADLTRHDAATQLAAAANKTAGTIDILVNCAGVEIASAYTKYSDAELDGVIDLDLPAPLRLLEDVLPSGGRAGRRCL